MADLYDRIFMGNPDSEEPELTVHSLTAVLDLYAHGVITSTQAKNWYNMDTAAIVDFDALVSEIDAASTIAGKLAVKSRLESAGIMTWAGMISTKGDYKTAIGI